MLCVAFGVTANFAMVPKFEEIREKIVKGVIKRLLPASSARNAG